MSQTGAVGEAGSKRLLGSGVGERWKPLSQPDPPAWPSRASVRLLTSRLPPS